MDLAVGLVLPAVFVAASYPTLAVAFCVGLVASRVWGALTTGDDRRRPVGDDDRTDAPE
ncbi:MAG: hypothetical protein ABEJ40_04710 [Haloarculaceae archaeon]